MEKLTLRIVLHLLKIVVVLAVLASIPIVAFTDGPVPPDSAPAAVPPSSAPAAAPGASAPQSLAIPLPGGNRCQGYTDNIHVSPENTWGIRGPKVHARTWCDYPVLEIHAETRLFMWRCNDIGRKCGFVFHGTDYRDDTQPNARLANGNSAGLECLNTQYQAKSYHHVITADGITRAGFTSHKQYLRDC